MPTLTQNARETLASDQTQTILKPTTSLDIGHPKRETYLDLRPEPIELKVKGVQRDIFVKFASERQEWEEAFKLVAANYRARGYEVASTKPFRFTPYNALPDTVTLVAKHADHVVATFSLVADNTMLGLPMETIYGEEIAQLRREGRRIFETISLADSGLSIREFMQVFLTMIGLCTRYLDNEGGDSMALTMNPRHKNFYEKVLGYMPLGPQRNYACVQDAPAVAVWQNLRAFGERAPRIYEEIYREPLSPLALNAPRLSRELIRHFDQQSNASDPEKIESVFSFVDHFGSPRRW
jgi:hypothetical protein